MTDFYQGRIGFQTQTVTVANGATTSDAVNLNGFGMVGLILPSALTSTAMTFTGSQDGTNYSALYNVAGTQLAITIAASRIVLFSPGDFVGINFVKLIAGSAEGSDRLIQVISRSFQ